MEEGYQQANSTTIKPGYIFIDGTMGKVLEVTRRGVKIIEENPVLKRAERYRNICFQRPGAFFRKTPSGKLELVAKAA